MNKTLLSLLLSTSVLCSAALAGDTYIQNPSEWVGIVDPVTNCLNNSGGIANGTCSNGMFSSGTITNPTSNQVILGPIDTTGANSAAFYYVFTSGTANTLIFQESFSTSGPWTPINIQTATNNSSLAPSFSSGSSTTIKFALSQKYLQVVNTSANAQVYSLSGTLRNTNFTPALTAPTNFGLVTTNTVSSFSAGTFNVPKISSSGYSIALPYSTPELTWQFSTNGSPITTATTTQLNAAGASGVRNYIDGIQLYNTGAAGTEIQILDGATVIWDGYLGAAISSNPGKIELGQLGIPLRGSTATAISIKTVSGTTISITGSIQGYQAN